MPTYPLHQAGASFEARDSEGPRGAATIALLAAAASGSRRVVWPAALLAITLIGTIDYMTGTEVRAFPLYFAPISLIAWHYGRGGVVLAAAISAGAWLGSNILAGQQYSGVQIWVINTVVQGASFTVVGMLIAVLRDSITRERALNRVDPLTLLLNTRAFYEDAQRMVSLCRRNGYAVTVAYVDLDRFKHVNDRLGHRAGDELLRAVGDIFRQNVRPSDLVARMGGDEFVVLLPHTDASGAMPVLERLRLALRTSAGSGRIRVSASIGAVTVSSAPKDVEEMVHDADACMYAAKKLGGDQVHVTAVASKPADDEDLLASCLPAKQYFQHRIAAQLRPRHSYVDAVS